MFYLNLECCLILTYSSTYVHYCNKESMYYKQAYVSNKVKQETTESFNYEICEYHLLLPR